MMPAHTEAIDLPFLLSNAYRHSVGDSDVTFTIQSAGKCFKYAVALEECGVEEVRCVVILAADVTITVPAGASIHQYGTKWWALQQDGAQL